MKQNIVADDILYIRMLLGKIMYTQKEMSQQRYLSRNTHLYGG